MGKRLCECVCAHFAIETNQNGMENTEKKIKLSLMYKYCYRKKIKINKTHDDFFLCAI